MKKIIALLLAVCFLLCGCGEKRTADTDKIQITATLFCEYDFAAAIAKDTAEIKMLMPPGSEIHSFEPSVQDIAAIKNSDIFIYIGGESEKWIEKIIKDIDTNKTAVIKMSDYVSLEAEDEEHGEHENENEYDEHIWTSPENARLMIAAIKDTLCRKYPEKSEIFEKNAADYIEEINTADAETKAVISNAETKFIVVADRFPFKYFTKYYGLEYTAAFGGCEHDTDADLATVSRLINAVNQQHLKTVFKLELSGSAVAQTVAQRTGATVLELHSAHNISADDFAAGVKYTDIMRRNTQALKTALNPSKN